MAYKRQEWVNGSDGDTPLSADRLNHQEAGIAEAHNLASAEATWDEVSGKPEKFPPAEHGHAASEITSGTFAAGRIPSIPQSKVNGLADVLAGFESRLSELESGGAA